MSNEKLFEEVELALHRELIPDERKFLILANKILERDRSQDGRETKAKGASAA